MGYSIKGDTIVFTFDKKDYNFAIAHKGDDLIELDNFQIENVTVAGNFNNWSLSSWTMEKIDQDTYQLKKKISDFDGDFNWEFKFVLNNSIWAEPKQNASNLTNSKTDFGSLVNRYNYQIIPSYISKNGNTKFVLPDFFDAKEVVLSGSFNKWDESAYQMIKTNLGWEITLELPPGKYQYKFIVDKEWIIDPSNPHKEMNEYEGYNSVIEVKKEVTFSLANYNDAQEVILAGSFNDWSETDIKMKKTSKGWEAKIDLPGGKFHYKYIVDGRWILDPNNSVKEYDYYGNINSVKMVK